LHPNSLVEEFLGYPISRQMMSAAEDRLEARWYASGESDFSIYDSADCLLWLLKYQWKALKSVALASDWLKHNRIPIERVLDHGAGLGFTSVALAESFPDAQVIATNYPGLQCDFNSFLLQRAGVRNLEFSDSALAERYDVVFAIEVFEHFKEPTAELDRLLGTNPAVLVDTTSFTVKSPGHFDEYVINGIVSHGYKRQEATVRFYRSIKRAGYRYHWTEFYNGRPRIWLRSDVVSLEATSRAWRRRLGKYQGDSGPLIVPV